MRNSVHLGIFATQIGLRTSKRVLAVYPESG